MVWISFKQTQPDQTFILSRDLKFSKITVADVTCDVNEFDPTIVNALFLLNDFNENSFLFSDGKINNTDWFFDLPVITDEKFNWHSTDLSKCHWQGSTQSKRYLRLRAVNDTGRILGNGEWGLNTELHWIIYFE